MNSIVSLLPKVGFIVVYFGSSFCAVHLEALQTPAKRFIWQLSGANALLR